MKQVISLWLITQVVQTVTRQSGIESTTDKVSQLALTIAGKFQLINIIDSIIIGAVNNRLTILGIHRVALYMLITGQRRPLPCRRIKLFQVPALIFSPDARNNFIFCW